jgi:PASTA domain
MRRATLAALAAAALTACGVPTAPAAPTTVIVTVPVPAPAAPAPAPASTPAETSWTMPNLVGSGLQDAQDAIQRLTGYGIAVTSSHDATGAGRMQVSDRNWKVCSQNVAPGETITSGTQIDFGVVKLDEDC